MQVLVIFPARLWLVYTVLPNASAMVNVRPAVARAPNSLKTEPSPAQPPDFSV